MPTTIGLTPGGGIGPEVLVAALAQLPPEQVADVAFRFFGPAETLQKAATTQGLDCFFDAGGLRIGACAVALAPYDGGQGPALERDALLAAVGEAQAGRIQALVTAPIHKAALADVPSGPFSGHTEFLFAHLGRAPRPLMLFAGGPFLLGLSTIHLPLHQVAAALTGELIQQRLDLLIDATRAIQGRSDVRVAVLGLNPHAGEGGLLGDEEQTRIRPALAALQHKASLEGPLPADGFFADIARGAAPPDAVLAMFHDQGLAPYKLLSAGQGVNITWGLNIVRTSPDHGTADALAGTGRADPGSMRAALEWAIRLTRT